MEIISLSTNEINQNGYHLNKLTRNKIGFIYTAPIKIVPDDCLSCDGYILKIIDYKKLFTVIGKTFNKGDEADDEFRIPDYNISKRFLQPGDDVGILIDAGLPQHTHSGSSSSNGAHTHTAQSSGSHKHDIGFDNYAGSRYGTVSKSGNYKQSGWGQAASNTNCAYTSTEGAHTHTTTSNGAHTHTITIGNASNGIYGKSSTVQPPSQVVHLCIKYR